MTAGYITREHISLSPVNMKTTMDMLPMNGTLEDTAREALRLAETERIRKALQETKGQQEQGSGSRLT